MQDGTTTDCAVRVFSLLVGTHVPLVALDSFVFTQEQMGQDVLGEFMTILLVLAVAIFVASMLCLPTNGRFNRCAPGRIRLAPGCAQMSHVWP